MINRFGGIAAVLGLAVLLLTAGPATARTIKPFVSDGCSFFPDGTPARPELWRRCCVEHDRLYWRGGTSRQRQAADEELRQCAASVGAPRIGAVMKVGVRVAGSPYLPFPFRWGFGWPYPRGYGSLSPAELEGKRLGHLREIADLQKEPGNRGQET